MMRLPFGCGIPGSDFAPANELRRLLDGKSDYVMHSLETGLFGSTKAIVFDAAGDERGGVALVVGELRSTPLVRLQSRCTYGEVFLSRHCDCRRQLEYSAELILAEGSGIVVYLDQEGRDAGIAMKARAYRALADEGVDTFSYYEGLGIPPDPRTYNQAVRLLCDLGLEGVRLLTNNPAKVAALEASGLKVFRVPLVVEADRIAASYIAAKRERGHLL